MCSQLLGACPWVSRIGCCQLAAEVHTAMFPDQANSSGREAQLRWTLLQQQAQQGDDLLKGPWLGSEVADRGQESCLHKHGQAAWNMGPLLQQQMNQGLVVQQSNQACRSARIH